MSIDDPQWALGSGDRIVQNPFPVPHSLPTDINRVLRRADFNTET
jgi:hypothetical protein